MGEDGIVRHVTPTGVAQPCSQNASAVVIWSEIKWPRVGTLSSRRRGDEWLYSGIQFAPNRT